MQLTRPIETPLRSRNWAADRRRGMQRLILPFLMALAAAAAAKGQRLAGAPHRSTKERSPAVAALQRLVGRNVLIRDHAAFHTERGEPATLFISVSNPVVGERDEHSGPGYFDGVPLSGVYRIGLVVSGKLINEIDLGNSAYPLRNTREENYEHWGQGTEQAIEGPAAEPLAPTKLLKLADFNEDGHAWEFRLLWYEDSSNFTTALFGYSAKQRKLIRYPVFDGPYRRYVVPNMFPNPSQSAARVVEGGNGCGNGAEFEFWTRYEYDPAREAWVAKSRKVTSCAGAAAQPPPSPRAGDRPAVVRFKPVTGIRGSTVTLEASVSLHGAVVGGIVLFIPYDPAITPWINEREGDDYWSVGEPWSVGCSELDDARCKWGMLRSPSLRDVDPTASDAPLVSFKLQIDPHASIGHHPIEAQILQIVGPAPTRYDFPDLDWAALARQRDVRLPIPAMVERGDVLVVEK